MRLDMRSWKKMGCPSVQVRLDGMVQSNVIFADEEEGKVIILHPCRFQPGMKDVPAEICQGHVQIEVGL